MYTYKPNIDAYICSTFSVKIVINAMEILTFSHTSKGFTQNVLFKPVH